MKLLGDFQTNVRRVFNEIDPSWEQYRGIVICGSHNPTNHEELIFEIKRAREAHTPFLGICYGHQLATIEYARNVLGIKDATSEEFGKGTFVVKKRSNIKVGWHEGETWWSNYETTLKWDRPPHFFTTPFHPEYQSYKGNPHPLLVDFLHYAKK